MGVAIINNTQIQKWVWLNGIRRNDGIVNIYTAMMMMIDRSLLAFKSRLQPCVWTFTNLLVADVRRSAAAPDPHIALMCTPRGPIAYYYIHPPALINRILPHPPSSESWSGQNRTNRTTFYGFDLVLSRGYNLLVLCRTEVKGILWLPLSLSHHYLHLQQ